MIEPRANDQALTVDRSVASQPHEATPARRPAAIGLAVLGAVIGALVRLVPHGWNLTPSYAAELFAGARLRAWQAFALAFGVRAIADFIIFCTPFRGQEDSAGFYLTILPWVYLSIALNVLLGRLVRRSEVAWKIGVVTLLGAAQFFVVTNFGSWLGSPIYPKTVGGIIECYVAAIPFSSPTLIAYIVFVPVLFGAHAALSRSLFPRERIATAAG